MPTVEERISAVEAKLDAVAELKAMIGEFRADVHRQFADVRTDMNRQFGELRSDMDRRFTEVDRRFNDVDRQFSERDRRIETLDHRIERHFMWMVGIQFTVLIAVIVALIETSAK
jgi:hypothetical protein